jgi:hypothetical protein
MEKLTLIQSELKAPKNQYNSFGKYKYRNCEDILEAVKPLLLKHKCVLIISDTIENIGNRFYVKATATFVFDGDKKIQVSAYAREEESKKGMDGSQVTGAASSYARKYALNGLFLIDDTKDADSDLQPKETAKQNTSNNEALHLSTIEAISDMEVLKSYWKALPLNEKTPAVTAMKDKVKAKIEGNDSNPTDRN